MWKRDALQYYDTRVKRYFSRDIYKNLPENLLPPVPFGYWVVGSLLVISSIGRFPLTRSSKVARSIPFLILLILVSPLTKAIVGKSYGATATIVPLTLAAAPLIGRMVESSLKEVKPGVIEAAVSMGAKTRTIIFKVLIGEARTSLLVGATIVLGTVLGYSAMAGVVGGGGLGDIAIRYGYYRYETGIMLVTLIVIVILVQLLQGIGMLLARKFDHRKQE